MIAAGGGICDATTLGGTLKMSEEVKVGSDASAANGIGLTLILPDTAVWLWHLTDGTSCGIDQYGSTTIRGNQPGGGGNRMVLAAGGGSQMDSIYCTDYTASSTNSIRAEGFAVWNNQSGSTFANGVVHIRNAGDQSSFTDIFAENYYGDVWHIDNASGGATFENIQGTSNGTANFNNNSKGGIPLTVGPGNVYAVSFHNSGFNAPGIGSPDILITGGSTVMGVNFYSTYMEGNGAVDPTTSMIVIDQDVGPVHFYGGVANTEQGLLHSTKTVFENHGTFLDVSGFEAVSTTLGINDVKGGVKTAVWDFAGNLGAIPQYRTAD